MKTKIKIISLFLILNIGTWITPQKSFAQVSVNFQIFYDDLSPYGYWVDNSNYGYVWVPNVSPDFTPYGTNGYWIFTNAGWTWVSNYPWGWAPFHYGRWYSDPVYGYMWVPGNEWGPGWVTWRRSEGYYGWAPIGPGISIELGYSNGYNVPYDQWTFVRARDFGSTNLNNYYINSSNNTTIINNSTVINNVQSDNSSHIKYNAGPDISEVEKNVGKKFRTVAIKENSKHSERLSKGEFQIYRPSFEKNNDTGKKPVPAKVTGLKELKPAGQRKPDTVTPNENQPSKRKQSVQPSKQNQTQSKQQVKPSKEGKKERPSPQVNPVQNSEGERQPQNKTQPAKQQIQQEPLNRPTEQKNPHQRQNIEPLHQQPLPQQSPQPQRPLPIQKKGGQIHPH